MKHVTGQALATPGKLHLLLVSLFATHEQLLAIRTPFFKILSLKPESTQEPVNTGGAVGEADGDLVGDLDGEDDGDLDGEGVPNVGLADGDGDGLIDSVGVFDGISLGT